MKCASNLALTVVFAMGIVFAASAADAPKKKEAPLTGPVSYYKHIRPILQANCQGCHQPAKAKGGYVMTDFARLLAGGDNKDKNGADKKEKKAAIVAKQPASSLLIDQITPVKGEAEMPKGQTPLAEYEIALITRWIAEGALDDTPAIAKQHYDMEHPPVYTMQPVITSLDYSPDGKLLAVAGFNEVLLHNTDGSGVAARLVGLSERIESVRFSPDGKLLAVAGGLPARMGEVQVWDVETHKLKISVPITYDTVYGVSWSPDGKQIAFGCADNTLRAIEAASGKQVLQQGSHADWVLDTAYSVKGDHIISLGRDMSAKLTEVATQRFVDNITSITPGALRGGLHSVSRHPTEERVLVGGADGAPQIYRIFRQTKREIGDNANLVQKYPEMTGRIFSVRFSKDGKKFTAASSLDNTGQVVIYADDGTAAVTDKIKAIIAKAADKRTSAENIELDKFQTQGIKLVAKLDVPGTGIYSVAFNPDGNTVAAAGQDGIIRFIQTTDGKIAKQFPAAPITAGIAAKKTSIIVAAAPDAIGAMAQMGQMAPPTAAAIQESLPKDGNVVALDVQPLAIKIAKPTDSMQILVTARLASGETFDVTRMVKFTLSSPVADISTKGHLSPTKDGTATLRVTLAKLETTVPVEISGLSSEYKVDFVRDVAPVLSRVGCNSGTCHGAKEGKNGFKLSLRGYDPIMDVRAFGDDLASRRINAASPEKSLMLLKPTAAVPHEGGQRLKVDDVYYQIILAWISDGAKLNSDSPRVAKIEIFPKDPVIQSIGSKQQMRVMATYPSGESRDVTAEAFVDSGNMDVATTAGAGLIDTLRRGEAPVMARYEGNYAATTITVMGDRSGFVWQDPPTFGRVDDLVAAKWKRMKIQPSELCNDTEFIRRINLDLTGLPPATEDVLSFISDARETRVKRDELIDKLIGNSDYVDHWAYKWADLLEVNRKYLGADGAKLFREWIRKQVEDNTPYDQFVRTILTASGSNKENPPASYFKVLREPAETMENTTHLFLATRFNCNKCHDHPFERWTQDQYYQTAAFFSQVELKKDPASGASKIEGSAVEDAKPLYEIISDKTQGDVKHLRTGKIAPPTFPFPASFELKDKEKATRRQQLAAWLTSPDNRYFAASYVNRLFGYLMGTGIIEPIDDIRAGNPPTNPELLDFLTKEFIQHNFDARYIMRMICKSRAYQLSIVPNKWNADDKINYSHAMARRLPAEVLYDTVFKVTGSMPNFPGMKPGTRAAQLPDSGIDLPSGFLGTLGRPPRESACECERSNDIRLGSVMSLLSGPTISDAIDDPKNAIAKLASSEPDDHKLVNEIYLRVLNRNAAESEIVTALKSSSLINEDNQKLAADLDAMEKKFAPIIAEQERARLATIEKSKSDLDAYEKAIAPKLAEDERKRLERVAADEKALKEYDAAVPQKLAEWEKSLTPEQRANSWIPLDAKEFKATNGIRLQKQSDDSFKATGPTKITDYTITAEVTQADITGVKLEVLPDSSLPKSGPGRAPDGNFVLTEIKFEWSAKGADKDKMTAAKFKDARADFTQKDFNVKGTIDGKSDAKKGWAISGTPEGKAHQASFQLEKPIGDAKGSLLKITLVQKFGETFNIGRFRLSITTSVQPLEFGLPASVGEIVKIDADKRTKEQNEALLAHFRATDSEHQKKEQSLSNNRNPLPIDPKVTELKAVAAKAQDPIKIEPKLIQLRVDMAMSAGQLKDKRLTGAQDLVWALINNPAFLFNH